MNKHQQYLKELKDRLSKFSIKYENIGEITALAKEIKLFEEFFEDELKTL